MGSRFRPAFVVTVAAVGASLSVAACATSCPEKVNNGDPCTGSRECKLKDGCGLNGWRCENGHWRELMTYCNPPPPPQDPVVPVAPDAGVAATDAGSAIGPPAPPSDAGTPIARPTAADAGAPNAACPAKIIADKACTPDGITCHEKPGCGSNGFVCTKGKWREIFTTCNPPPPPVDR